MNNHSDKHHRRSIRLAGYDYSQEGAYFVTISVARRVRRNNPFGHVENGVMRPNGYGKIVADEWLKTAQLRPNVILDEWMVMPNHFHGILIITDDDVGATRRVAPTDELPTDESLTDDDVRATRRVAPMDAPTVVPTHETLQSGSLGAIVGQFKSIVTKRVNLCRIERDLPKTEVWHRNFHERIIRDERELDNTRRYIAQNPQNWESDEEYTVPS